MSEGTKVNSFLETSSRFSLGKSNLGNNVNDVFANANDCNVAIEMASGFSLEVNGFEDRRRFCSLGTQQKASPSIELMEFALKSNETSN